MNKKNLLKETLQKLVEEICNILQEDERLQDMTFIAGEVEERAVMKVESKHCFFFIELEPILLNLKTEAEFDKFMENLPIAILQADAQTAQKSKEDRSAERYSPTREVEQSVLNEVHSLAYNQKSFLNNVYMTIVNPKELAEEAVTRNILSMTVAYYITDEYGNVLRFIGNKELTELELNEKHLYASALLNMARNSEAVFKDALNDKQFDMLLERCKEKSPIYSLGDKEFGVVGFLIPIALPTVAGYLGEDFYFIVCDDSKIVIHPKSMVPLELIKKAMENVPTMIESVFSYDSENDEFFTV